GEGAGTQQRAGNKGRYARQSLDRDLLAKIARPESVGVQRRAVDHEQRPGLLLGVRIADEPAAHDRPRFIDRTRLDAALFVELERDDTSHPGTSVEEWRPLARAPFVVS